MTLLIEKTNERAVERMGLKDEEEGARREMGAEH